MQKGLGAGSVRCGSTVSSPGGSWPPAWGNFLGPGLDTGHILTFWIFLLFFHPDPTDPASTGAKLLQIAVAAPDGTAGSGEWSLQSRTVESCLRRSKTLDGLRLRIGAGFRTGGATNLTSRAQIILSPMSTNRASLFNYVSLAP